MTFSCRCCTAKLQVNNKLECWGLHLELLLVAKDNEGEDVHLNRSKEGNIKAPIRVRTSGKVVGNPNHHGRWN